MNARTESRKLNIRNINQCTQQLIINKSTEICFAAEDSGSYSK